jgi:hypothetical protein
MLQPAAVVSIGHSVLAGDFAEASACHAIVELYVGRWPVGIDQLKVNQQHVSTIVPSSGQQLIELLALQGSVTINRE